MTTAARFPDGKTTVARAIQAHGVELTMPARLPTPVSPSNKPLTPATGPIHVGSTGMMTFIKPPQNNEPGRNGTSSNNGLERGVGRRASQAASTCVER